MDSLVLLSSSRIMGVADIVAAVMETGDVVEVAYALSADILTTPSEQKLRSGPTMVGELDRESLGEEALARELRLEVMGSRMLTGDPVNDVIEASSADAAITIDILGEAVGMG